MNSSELRSVLTKCKIFKDYNTGVYAADTLPIHVGLPCAVIANTDPKNKPGEHWVAFFIDRNGVCEFFDSFGEPPIIGHHKVFIKRNSYQCYYNNFPLQSPTSTVCGHYCLCFLYLKCMNVKSIKTHFTSDRHRNDSFVKCFASKIMNTNEKVYNKYDCIIQTCTKRNLHK